MGILRPPRLEVALEGSGLRLSLLGDTGDLERCLPQVLMLNNTS